MYNNYSMPYMRPEQIIKVNGENGARALQMMPNSSVLVLDENTPTIFLCQTDGAGYKTITPYTITPKETPKAVELNDILNRLTKLEEKVNESHTKPNQPVQSDKYDATTTKPEHWERTASIQYNAPEQPTIP